MERKERGWAGGRILELSEIAREMVAFIYLFIVNHDWQDLLTRPSSAFSQGHSRDVLLYYTVFDNTFT